MSERASGLTERDMLDRLHVKHSQTHGNGPRWAVAEHVKDTAGGTHTRTADFIAQDLWRSKGLELHGFEVKVSRSDWLTELRDPSKAEAFRPFMHRWWLVAARDVVRDDLPEGWGLMVARGRGLTVVQPAPLLTPKPLPPPLRASLMRATAKTAQRRLIRRILSGDLPRCERFVSPCTCEHYGSGAACLPCQLAAAGAPPPPETTAAPAATQAAMSAADGGE